MANRSWTKESVLEESKRYETYCDFHKYAGGASKYAERHGFSNECKAHMFTKTFWDIEKTRAEALLYKTPNEFCLKSNGAYQWAVRNGKLDEITQHMIRMPIWDFESVKKEALKYSHRQSFRIGSQGAAQWAARNGLFETVCDHMDLASKSDYNVAYIWKVLGYENLYKIGVTSERLGEDRIHFVARKCGFSVEVLWLVPVKNATSVETKMLSYGKPANISKLFSGFSEFRELTDSECVNCIRLLTEASS